jgi:hypothetical protein
MGAGHMQTSILESMVRDPEVSDKDFISSELLFDFGFSDASAHTAQLE